MTLNKQLILMTFLRKHARSRSHTEIATELHHQQVSSCAHSIALEDLLVDWCHCGLSWSACWRSSCSFSWIILCANILDLIYDFHIFSHLVNQVIRRGSGLVRWSLEHISFRGSRCQISAWTTGKNFTKQRCQLPTIIFTHSHLTLCRSWAPLTLSTGSFCTANATLLAVFWSLPLCQHQVKTHYTFHSVKNFARNMSGRMIIKTTWNRRLKAYTNWAPK